jgi:hypothetical protein
MVLEVTQYSTHEECARSVRRQVVSTAKAMLDGQLSFLIGSRWLAALRHELMGLPTTQTFWSSLLSTQKPTRYRSVQFESIEIKVP